MSFFGRLMIFSLGWKNVTPRLAIGLVCVAEEYIEGCLNSVFGNAHQDIQFEVLVIDDCSTDSTFERLKGSQKYNANLSVLKTPRNSGPGGARNLGVENASGDWILFLDSDDCYDSSTLIKLKRCIDTNNEPELDAIGYNWTYNRNSIHKPKTHFIGRMDGHYLELEKDQLITHYVLLEGQVELQLGLILVYLKILLIDIFTCIVMVND